MNAPTPLASRRRRRLPDRSRALVLSTLVALIALPGAGCEEAAQQDSDAILHAWRRSGLMPTTFNPVEADDLKPGKCRQGRVDGIEVLLCRFAEAAAARAARSAGLARVGESTGLAVTAGKLLLVVTDREGKDPTGRTINQIGTVFRDAFARSDDGDGEARQDGGPSATDPGDGEPATE